MERNKLKHYFTERNGTYKNKWLLMGARDKFETFKNIGTMNAGLVDSFQMAKCVLISIHWLIISFARMLGITHVRVITHVLRWLYTVSSV